MESVVNNAELGDVIKMLDENAKLKDIIAKVNELSNRLNSAKHLKTRDRGPESKREMDENDARRILLGDLKDESHKSAAEKLELSYGQIYSARKGFTFKGVYKEFRDAQ